MVGNDFAPKFTDEQLLAYLDGIADPDVAAQIEGSPADRKRAEGLARMQNHLTSRLFRIECPESETLGEYLLGFLARTQSRAVEAHLRECPHCAGELAQLRDFLGAAVPESGSRAQEKIRTLVAWLVSGPGRGDQPSRLTPSFALRGQRESVAIYETENSRISMEVREDRDQPGKKAVIGLVTGPANHSLEVKVRQGEVQIAASEVDEFGNFVISGLPSGTYDFEIIGSTEIIQIPGFEIN